MATQRQLRRGTAAENAAFTGAVAETVYETENERLINHDGATTGGMQLPNRRDIQNNYFTAADAGGTANAVTLTLAALGQKPTAYAEYQSFTFKPSANNTAAVTLNIDTIGVKDIKKDDGSGTLVALEADDLKLNIPVTVVYDGTQFIAQLGGGGGGQIELLATLTADDSYIDFTSVMDSVKYSSYKIVVEDYIQSSSPNGLAIRGSINNGTSFIATGEYKSRLETNSFSNNTFSADNSSPNTLMTLTGNLSGNYVNGEITVGIGEISIDELFCNAFFTDAAASHHGAGRLYSVTSEINALRILRTDGGVIDKGIFTMYGIKR